MNTNGQFSCGSTLAKAARAGLLLGGLMVGPLLAASPGAPTTGGVFEWQPFLAPFHSVLLHFPIGFITLAFLLEVYCWWKPSNEVRRVVAMVLGLSVLSAAVAAGLGWLRASGGDYDTQTLSQHRQSGVAVVALAVVALAMHAWASRHGWPKVLMAAYRLSLATTVALMIYAGHQGGNLTHGSKYLVKNAPEFVRSLIEDEPDEPAETTSYADEKERFFVEKVRPIFETKCRECHSAEKQKGGYRLDEKEIALHGGKSGETAIKPGDPIHSNLVRLITLPPHDDDIMPPEGKSTLTSEEIVNIIHWIGSGAHFPEKTPAVTNAPTLAQVETNAVETPKPEPAVVLTETNVPTAVKVPAAVIIPRNGSVTYSHDIKPIFDAHCVACHGPEKQKRGLRLDSLSAVLHGARGGEAVVVPGRAGESLIYRRITIPEETDPTDEHMPPPHKKVPLSPSETELIARWINAGLL